MKSVGAAARLRGGVGFVLGAVIIPRVRLDMGDCSFIFVVVRDRASACFNMADTSIAMNVSINARKGYFVPVSARYSCGITAFNTQSKAVKMLHDRPRKLLDFKTPAYLMQQKVAALAA